MIIVIHYISIEVLDFKYNTIHSDSSVIWSMDVKGIMFLQLGNSII
jgi:hypothetical protein